LDGDVDVVELPVTVEFATDNEVHSDVPVLPAVFGTTPAALLGNNATGAVLPGTLLALGVIARKLPFGTDVRRLDVAVAGAIFCTAPAAPPLECFTSATRLLFGLTVVLDVLPSAARDAKSGTFTNPSFELATIKRTGCVWVFAGRLAASPDFQLLVRLGPRVRTFSTDFPTVKFAPCALLTLDTTTACPLFTFVAPVDDTATGIWSC